MLFLFFKQYWSQITSEKKQLYMHYLNELLDSENGTKNKKISVGANFRKEFQSVDGYILGKVNNQKLKFSGS